MVWRVTNEPVDCRPSRGTNKHTQDRKRCSLLDDNSTATADYDSAHANYTVNYIRQLQNHDYIHMTTTTSYKSILLHVTVLLMVVRYHININAIVFEKPQWGNVNQSINQSIAILRTFPSLCHILIVE